LIHFYKRSNIVPKVVIQKTLHRIKVVKEQS